MGNGIVPVVFRVYPGTGEVLALFPTIIENFRCCASYQHVGQHGSANYAECIQSTRRARHSEYADLKRELESAPYKYKLRVYTRKPVFGM